MAISLILAVTVFFIQDNVLAFIDDLSLGVEEEYVAVTVEVKLDCTRSDIMYSVECVKRVTDHVADTFADLKVAEEMKHRADDLYSKAFDAHNLAVDQLNTYTK